MNRIAVFLVGLTGFTSLSYELLWARAFGVMSGFRAFAFPLTLGLFLLGIAIGSRWSKKFSENYDTGAAEALRTVSMMYAGACAVGFVSVPLMSVSAYLGQVGWTFALYLVCAGAALFGAQFPLLAHHGIPPSSKAGAHLSYLYVSNIIGSVAGTLLTGFVLMDLLTMGELVAVLTVGGLVAACLLFMHAEQRPGQRRKAVLGLLASVVLVILITPVVYGPSMWGRLHYVEFGSVDVAHVVQTKGGVIMETRDGNVYGGGIYDGHFSVDPVIDENGIIRPYSLAAFHPDPKKVLIIGLASGSWARAVAANPNVEEMVIVEIDPGYLKLAEAHPTMQKLLEDKRTRVIIDDGRRWLNSTDEKFDAVVSNTTWHYRSMASSLLSVEFMELIKEHLEPGGVFFFNTTESPRAVKSGLVSFPHTYAVLNTVVASVDGFDYDAQRLAEFLRNTEIDGEPLFDFSDDFERQRFEYIVKNFENPGDKRSWVRTEERLESFSGDEPPVTDSNMGGEWKTTWIVEILTEDDPNAETLWLPLTATQNAE